jgi:uncharacterized protein YndB with AHSA1/START domain
MSTAGEHGPVEATRRIEAPAHAIFAILTDPVRHLDLDGSGMLRGAVTTAPVTCVGDAFVMKMYFEAHGDYQMINHVVEFEPDRLIGWEPQAGQGHPSQGAGDSEERWGHRWSYRLTPDGPDATIVTERYDCSRAPEEERIGMQDGAAWMDAMTATLRRLDALCAHPS